MPNPDMLGEIRDRGWTTVPFDLPASDRASYAAAANGVLELALHEAPIADALTFDLLPDITESVGMAPGLFWATPGGRLDGKVKLHAGYQSRQRADAAIPERNQPAELQNFWPLQDDTLAVVEQSFTTALRDLGVPDLVEAVFPSDRDTRNVHLRTIRYLGAATKPVGEEVIAAHADMAMITEFVYGSHGNWIHATPYPREVVIAADSPERAEAVNKMRANLQLVSSAPEGETVFFLGAGWHGLPDGAIGDEQRSLPSCYHAGYPPPPEMQRVSEFAASVVGDTDDRVAVVAIAYPNLQSMQRGGFSVPGLAQCAPKSDL